ncbi:hypothetical protein [Vibrio splendidus]|uniref:hypothetical protein n=1 Tax=Vibrio splendidus TaxID=29497 RepID=UPI000C839142|nr:hypothetical protein [Vibrio splendidus]PMG53820.1 hypothetical protein BCU89_17630 [Vibrio splendidus]
MAEVQAIKDDDTIRMVGHLLSIRCHPQMADVYQSTKDIDRVMKMLRHTSEGVTLRYIGITQDEVDKGFVSLEL